MLAEAKSETRKQERMQSRFSRQFCSWSSETTWFQSFGNLLYQSRLWRISRRASQTSWRNRSTRKSTSRNSNQKHSWSGRIEESSGNANRRILQGRIERKSRYNTGAHFTSTRVAGKENFEWFQRISRFRVDSQWKIISRSQSTGSRSKSSSHVEPRPKPATRYMEYV